ncbi:MAG: glycoside hydrolase family 13 protein [Christensenella sp.]
MQEIDFSKQIMHDSAKEKYRFPLGAVTLGTKVELCLVARDIYCKKVFLTVMEDGMEKNIEMAEADGVWRVEYETPQKPCVVWYWFCICIDEEKSIYYGARSGHTVGAGTTCWNPPPAFQLTVYDEAFSTPLWAKNAIMYQIFPDRYARSDDDTFMRGVERNRALGRNVIVHESWDEPVIYEAAEGQKAYEPCDYYGGTLAGIIESLDYLRDMGVGVLYLNPIVEAASNHRYNTGDYKHTDSMLGTDEDAERLMREAQIRGIHVILDGVYSHTGDDSIYFNKYGRYDSVGAYESKESPYYNWYQFEEYPQKYKSWWGFETLPEVDETQSEWVNYIIDAEDSVFGTWIKRGAAGFRLDVADELPDKTIEQMRDKLKHMSQDNLLIGEVWEDATTKQSYGNARTYALGRGLDTVMNYPFTAEVTAFLSGKGNAARLKHFMVGQSQNYPKDMYYCLMNLLSSHDIARIRTVLATKIDAHTMTREQQAHFVVTKEQDDEGARLQKLAAGIQFTIPGMPCVYYGDEVGMHGLLDPFNRGTYHVYDEDMRQYYKELAALRQKTDALKTGNCVFYAQGEDTIGILRYCIDGEDAFSNPAADGIYLTLVNRSNEPHSIAIDLFANEELAQGKHTAAFRELDFERAVCVLTNEVYSVNEGLVEAAIPPKSIRILELMWI